MKKCCLFCGNQYTKKVNCSLKDWEISKFCSRICRDKYKIDRPSTSKTKFKKNDKRLIGNKINLGRKPWNKGKTWSQEIRDKISKSLTGRSTGRIGEKCNFWKGGKTSDYKQIKNSIKYKNWRRAVFERDNYTCQKCGAKNGKGVGKTIILHPHHIKEFAKYPNLRFETNNGITLCIDCHKKEHFGE